MKLNSENKKLIQEKEQLEKLNIDKIHFSGKYPTIFFKEVKKFDEATELIRKEQKERKRRQYIKKMNEAQQKATFDKILNETGRKFRQRE